MKKSSKITLWIVGGTLVLGTFFALIEEASKPKAKPLAVRETQEKEIISDDEIKKLIGNPVPYEKWAEWGSPKTLDNTDNFFWFVYLDKADISFVSEKSSDLIIFAIRGRGDVEDLIYRADVWIRCQNNGLLFKQCFPN